MHQLVAVILTKDESRHIGDCVGAVRPWVDAVVVWDSLSHDGTQGLAQAAGALVVERPFDNYSGQRQAALDGVEAEWVLFVDADERVTPALGQEVRSQIDSGGANGYWIPRRNLIVGREMRFGGYYPDYQLRLLRRAAARYDLNRVVHEYAEVEGEVGWLKAPFIHYNYESWAQFHRKQRAYARYEAMILAGKGIRPRLHNFILQPWREFVRRFLTLAGWRDGWRGLRLALLLAWYYGFMPYWLLWRQRGA
ncbi:MAG: glycosyltransferase family 2 protein [Caldilineaceae bacterium]|nr:glycosyltransferase family 2 protein [Caldilineaceae bacterium]